MTCFIINKINCFRLLWAVTYAALVYFTPTFIRKDDVVNVPTYYYVILGSIMSINEVSFYKYLPTIHIQL